MSLTANITSRFLNRLRQRSDWRLRPACTADVDGLHRLTCIPVVYRFLFDNVAPEKSVIAEEIAQCMAEAEDLSVGLWLLENANQRYAGCVRLVPDRAQHRAELSYFLDPAYWGQGLATRMGWTAIQYAFASPYFDSVFAGADLPNKASIAVMQRLGMRFSRHVTYPLGEGVEYVLTRSDTGPEPKPALLAMSAEL